jgi:hypothetical protein
VLLAAAGRRELGRREVHGNRAPAAAGQPGGDVRRAAAELDDVTAVDLAQGAQPAVGDGEQSPGDLVRRPGPSGIGVRELGVDRSPQRSVEVERLPVDLVAPPVATQDSGASESTSATISADASALTACRAIFW